LHPRETGAAIAGRGYLVFAYVNRSMAGATDELGGLEGV
jgi:hypothetical protein